MMVGPAEQLQEMLRDPHSEPLRKRFFGVLAAAESLADVEPWIKAAWDLRTRGVIDDDGFVYFAAIFLESLTLGNGVADPELVRIQREIDALSAVASWKRGDDDDEPEPWKDEDNGYDRIERSPEMLKLYKAYDARAVQVTAEYLRELGFHELADDVERDPEAFERKSALGASKLFDEDMVLD